MPAIHTSPSHDKTRTNKENKKDFCLEDSTSYDTVIKRRAAVVYGVPESTLKDHIVNLQDKRVTRLITNYLPPTYYFKGKDVWSFSADDSNVRELILSVTGQELGKDWVTRGYCKRTRSVIQF